MYGSIQKILVGKINKVNKLKGSYDIAKNNIILCI